MTTRQPVIPPGILLPFVLLTSLFAAWGLANNMTDTLLAAFKRIMSMTDGKTAWIQVACYLFGYGCFAIPGAMFMKRYTYKSGVLLGLAMFILGGLLFYPAMFVNELIGSDACFLVYLVAMIVLFAGLSILETACNPYICAMGPEQTATRRLNFAQSFNPLGSIGGIIIAQIFILSQLKTESAEQRAAMTVDELNALQRTELFAVTNTYGVIAIILIAIWLAILFTRMPALSETDKRIDLFNTWKRLGKNYHYMWGVAAQFFYVGAQIAVWSFIIRYSMVALQIHPDEVLRSIPTKQLAAIPYTAINDENPVPPLIDSLRWNIPHDYQIFDPSLPASKMPTADSAATLLHYAPKELAKLPTRRTADMIDVLRHTIPQDRLTELIEPIGIAFAADKFSLVPVNKIADIPVEKQVEIIEVLKNEVGTFSNVHMQGYQLEHLIEVLRYLFPEEEQLRAITGDLEGLRFLSENAGINIPLAQLIMIVDGVRNGVSAAEVSQWSEERRIELFDAVCSALPDLALRKIPTKRFEALFMEKLRNADPLQAAFCNTVEFLGLTVLLPKTSEQAAATYYVYSLFFFVASRFICTWLMKFVAPHLLLTLLAFLATTFCVGTVYLPGVSGVYSLIAISACMSLMFPTIFGLGTRGLGEDTKMGGAGMVMAICGAALLTQMQGYFSDAFGIRLAYWVPALAFLVIAYYAAVVCRNDDRFE